MSTEPAASNETLCRPCGGSGATLSGLGSESESCANCGGTGRVMAEEEAAKPGPAPPAGEAPAEQPWAAEWLKLIAERDRYRQALCDIEAERQNLQGRIDDSQVAHWMCDAAGAALGAPGGEGT